MQESEDIQVQLFKRLRAQLPEHFSLVDEIAELLEISNDSAYRRIRGEKPISLQEVQKLATHFSLSVDDLVGSRGGTITFRANLLDPEEYTFHQWLQQLLQLTSDAGSKDEIEVTFILNELNIFHIIQFPEICAFKLFFWQKSNLGFKNYKDARFSAGHCDEEIRKLSDEITAHFVKVKTIEFTTEECLNSFLKQILFYTDAGYFETRDDALKLCGRLHDMIGHLQRQAELGFKFPFGRPEVGDTGNFKLYHNDLVLADNTTLIKTPEGGSTVITSNAINLMQSHDPVFFDYNYRWGTNLLTKSVQISGSAEKERNKFFRSLKDQVDRVSEKI